jgi:hypothetical protein
VRQSDADDGAQPYAEARDSVIGDNVELPISSVMPSADVRATTPASIYLPPGLL